GGWRRRRAAGIGASTRPAAPRTSGPRRSRRSRSITNTGRGTWWRPRRSRCESVRSGRGGTASPESSGSSRATSAGGARRFLSALRALRLRCFLPALGRLRPELLREPLDAPFRVDQLLAPREERVAVRTDFQVQLGLRRARLPGRAARAPHVDVVVLRMNAFLHGGLPGNPCKTPIIPCLDLSRDFRRPVPPVGPQRVA